MYVKQGGKRNDKYRTQKGGPLRELNPGPLPPWGRIIPLDQVDITILYTNNCIENFLLIFQLASMGADFVKRLFTVTTTKVFTVWRTGSIVHFVNINTTRRAITTLCVTLQQIMRRNMTFYLVIIYSHHLWYTSHCMIYYSWIVCGTILNPRPALDSSAQTTRGMLLDFLS